MSWVPTLCFPLSHTTPDPPGVSGQVLHPAPPRLLISLLGSLSLPSPCIGLLQPTSQPQPGLHVLQEASCGLLPARVTRPPRPVCSSSPWVPGPVPRAQHGQCRLTHKHSRGFLPGTPRAPWGEALLRCLVWTAEACTAIGKANNGDSLLLELAEEKAKKHFLPPYRETRDLHHTETRLKQTERGPAEMLRGGDSERPVFVKGTTTHHPDCPSRESAGHPKPPLPQCPHPSVTKPQALQDLTLSSVCITLLHCSPHRPCSLEPSSPPGPHCCRVSFHTSLQTSVLQHLSVPVTHCGQRS